MTTAFIANHLGRWSPDPPAGTAWVSPALNGSFGPASAPNGDYTWEITIDAAGFPLGPPTTLAVDAICDDIINIDVNGTTVVTTPIQTAWIPAPYDLPVSLLVDGPNVIRFRCNSIGGVTGLLVSRVELARP